MSLTDTIFTQCSNILRDDKTQKFLIEPLISPIQRKLKIVLWVFLIILVVLTLIAGTTLYKTFDISHYIHQIHTPIELPLV